MELKPLILAEAFMVPMLIVFVLTVAIAAALLSWRRRKAEREESIYTSTFLPPIIVDGNMPKEQTYIVPRSWKPPREGTLSSSVYAPLSVPIEQSQQSRSMFSRGVLSQAVQPQFLKEQVEQPTA